MTTWIHRCLIVPDANVVYARELSAAVAGSAGSGMYTTALSADGSEPATHWISVGLIGKEFADLMPCTSFVNEEDVVVPVTTAGNAELVAQLANDNGFETTVEAVQALFDVSDITEQDGFTAMARLGLQIVTPSVEAPVV